MKKITLKVLRVAVELALIFAITSLFVPALLSAQSTVAVVCGFILLLMVLVYVVSQAIQAIGRLIAMTRK